MENLTATEVVSFMVGTLLLCATIVAPKLDGFFSISQRRLFGMCRKYGNPRMIVCSHYKGTRLIKSGGPFGFDLLDGSSNAKSVPCKNCQAKGCLSCIECSKA